MEDPEEIKHKDYERLIELIGKEETEKLFRHGYNIKAVKLRLFIEETKITMMKYPWVTTIIILLLIYLIIMKGY